MLKGIVDDVQVRDRCPSTGEVRDIYERAVLASDHRQLSVLIAEGKEQFAETYPAEQWFDDMIRRARLLEGEE